MIDTTNLRELAKMTPEQNTDYERLKQAAASVWFAGNMYIGPSMRELMRFFGEYKRLSPEYEQPATAPAGYKVVPDALRKLCKSATPGPWYVSAPAEHAVWKDIGDRRYLIADTSDGFTDDNNSEYIAAANPATVLALLDELDRLRKVESATLQGEKIGCRRTYTDNQTVDTERLYHRAIRSERDRLRAELTAMREDLNDAPEPEPVSDGHVYVHVSGLTGSGKSAVAGEIEIAMRAIGLDVEWVDSKSEKRLTHADYTSALELYRPKVRIFEKNIPRTAPPAPSVPDAGLARDAALLDALEDEVKSRGLFGVSLDYTSHAEDGLIVEKGYRVLMRKFLGPRKTTLRDAISAAFDPIERDKKGQS